MAVPSIVINFGSLITAVLSIIGMWKIFQKAGKPGWAAIVPFYNSYVLFDIVWGNGWLFLLTFIPFGGAIVLLISHYQLAMRFGKSSGFGVGMIFLPWLFLFLLGIEEPVYAQGTFLDAYGNPYTQQYIANGYQGPRNNGKKAAIISGIICGIIGIVLTIILTVAIILAASSMSDNGTLEEFGNMVEEILEEENIGIGEDGLIGNTHGSAAVGADGKFEDMEALAEYMSDQIDMDDDNMEVEVYGFENTLYLDLYYMEDIPAAAESAIATALGAAMDSYVQEAFGDVYDMVSCDDPTVIITVYNKDYDEIWSQTYTK